MKIGNSAQLNFTALAILAGLISSGTLAQASEPAISTNRYVPGQMIVRFRAKTSIQQARTILDNRTFEVSRALIPSLNLYLVKTKQAGLGTLNAIRMLSRNPQVRYAQPDHIIRRRETTPNDSDFSKQWSLNQSSQVDISATRAWDLGTGGTDKGGHELVVAVVDGGMDINHNELRDNIWTNRSEIAGNGQDDDGNGYVDDIHGWNAFDHNGNIPSDRHATHVGGIVGAKGNNGSGIAGLNWNVKIMPVAAASGTTSVVAEGYGYVLAQKKLWIQSHGTKGANIVSTNSSFGVDYADCKSGEFPVWNDLYTAMGEAGILSAVATANLNINVDERGDVPSGCTSQYLVTVTNTNNKDERHYSAAYGLKTINLGAPGTAIYSTLPGNSFGNLTGTSMATPHVAGAIAFLHSVASPEFYNLSMSNPAQAALVLKQILLANVDQIPSMKGMTTSGGRLNLFKAGQAIAHYKRRR